MKNKICPNIWGVKVIIVMFSFILITLGCSNKTPSQPSQNEEDNTSSEEKIDAKENEEDNTSSEEKTDAKENEEDNTSSEEKTDAKENEEDNTSSEEKTDADVINLFKDWLSQSDRDISDAILDEPLSQNVSQEITKLLQEDLINDLKNNYRQQFLDRKLELKNYKMPFYYKIYGSKPADGRSLYISLHGGGSTTPDSNNQEYKNQKTLYDNSRCNEMTKLEGIYLAPRAPTDTWNMWHRVEIDDFFNLLIQLIVYYEDVDPNKVYLLGYSAGGDGVYQLAPRMSDRLAAASMMAGHPNETIAEGFRNIPLSIQVGERDNAFNRASVAESFGEKLKQLASEDTGGYYNFYKIWENKGHWMDYEDALALPWMAAFTRNPIPDKLVWVQDDIRYEHHYWLEMKKSKGKIQEIIRANYDKQANKIEITEDYSNHIIVNINDDMLNLDEPITVKYKGKTVFNDKVKRKAKNIYRTLKRTGDTNLSFSVSILIENGVATLM